jgi:hypothetical protein
VLAACVLLLQVTETSSWDEAGVPCTQFEVKVTNGGISAASSMKLVVQPPPGCELGNSWNSTRLPDEGGAWRFDLPDWCAAAGGLAAGAHVVVGMILKGTKPNSSAFALA